MATTVAPIAQPWAMKTRAHPPRSQSSLQAAVERASKEDGTSINQFVVTAVAERLAVLTTADCLTGWTRPADLEAARRLLRRTGGQSPAPDDVL